MVKHIKRIALILAIIFSISIFSACNIESLIPSNNGTPASTESVTPKSFSYLGETYGPHIATAEQFNKFYQYAALYKIDKAYLYLDFLPAGATNEDYKTAMNNAASTVDIAGGVPPVLLRCVNASEKLWEFTFTGWGNYDPNNTTKEDYPSEYYTPIVNMATVKSADANKREATFNEFKIDALTKTASVTTSDQLYYVVSKGVKPVPTAGSIAETIYNKAKQALRETVDDTMTDVEKVIAICDWLSKNVTYDGKMIELKESGTETKQYNAHYLEGAFIDGRAVCDGFSKAFVLLTRIEGIESVMIEGEAGGGHAWNKVNIPKDNEAHWYVVDNTWNNSGTSGDFDLEIQGKEDYELSTRAYTFVTDADIATTHTETAGKNYPQALGGNTDVDTYASILYKPTASLKITSKAQLKDLLKWVKNKLDSEEWEDVRFSMIDLNVTYNYGGNFGNEVSDVNTMYLIGLDMNRIRFGAAMGKQYMIFIP